MISSLPPLTFIEALSLFARKITVFSGRSRRSEFCYVYLAYLVMIVLCKIVEYWMIQSDFSKGEIVLNVVYIILSLLLLPIEVRRLHDVGKSGWWLMLPMLLGIGTVLALLASELLSHSFVLVSVFCALALLASCLYLLYLLFMDGEMYENRYGVSPKYYQTESD